MQSGNSLERRAAAMRARQANQKPARVVVSPIVVGHQPDAPPCLDRIRRLLVWLWSVRACFVCGRSGACAHRQPDVDLAELAAAYQRMR